MEEQINRVPEGHPAENYDRTNNNRPPYVLGMPGKSVETNQDKNGRDAKADKETIFDSFPKDAQMSLRAFTTIFKIRPEGQGEAGFNLFRYLRCREPDNIFHGFLRLPVNNRIESAFSASPDRSRMLIGDGSSGSKNWSTRLKPSSTTSLSSSSSIFST